MKFKNGTDGQPSCVLLCGKTGLLDYGTIQRISEHYNVVIAGKVSDHEAGRIQKNRKIHIFDVDMTSEKFERIMYSYSPDAVWFFSGYADDGSGLSNEQKKIEKLIENCKANDTSKIVLISSVNSQKYKISDNANGQDSKEYASLKAFDCAKMEEHARFCADKAMLTLITLRVPFISNFTNRGNYLGRAFNKLTNGDEIELPYNRKQKMDIISIHNLVQLLIAITEETLDSTAEYAVLSGYDHTYGDFGDALKKCKAELKVNYQDKFDEVMVISPKKETERLRKNYGFISTDDIFEDIEEIYEKYHKKIVQKAKLKDNVKKILSFASKNSFKIAELIILFILVQLLLPYTADSVYFRYVDIRLFFVVVLGISHGMYIGVLAGILQCISLVLSYSQVGVTGSMLFYNTDYWLPFAIYIMTGAITGYLVSTRDKKIGFAEKEIKTLQDKYVFLNKVYMSVIQNKDEYKRQILGYQDSFGKIFEAVEKLNSSITSDIFMNGVNTLESILNNSSIAIYTMDDYQKYGRLVACSRKLTGTLKKSIKVSGIADVYETVLKGDTYKNTDFAEDHPVYAYGIVENEKVRLLICLYEAAPEQMSLYYTNLFTIMGNLIRVAFLRALEYQEAIESDKYFDGTEVLKPDYFDKELESCRRMSDAGVSSYMLVKLETNEINAASEYLDGLVRQSDITGKSSDGNLYLLLTQIDREIFKTIGERLDSHKIAYSVVEGV